MSDCIFCQIAAGEIPSHTVYEDDTVCAFLDANPLVEGHTLVIPRDHYETTAELPADVGGALGRAVTRLAPAVETAVDAAASTIGINNGPEAGQEIDHLHVHIVPRTATDRGGAIHSVVGQPTPAEDDELTTVADAIDSVLSS